MSELEGKEPPPYDILKIALTRDREQLYQILDHRVDAQIAAGLLDEVRGLLAMGMTGEEPAFTSIGYGQLLPVLAGDQSLDDAIARIKRDTHRYVRHQMIWLRRTPALTWLDTSQAGWSAELDALVLGMFSPRVPLNPDFGVIRRVSRAALTTYHDRQGDEPGGLPAAHECTDRRSDEHGRSRAVARPDGARLARRPCAPCTRDLRPGHEEPAI